MGLRIFTDNQPDPSDKEKIKKLYSNYEREWEEKQDETFFGEHKVKFKEKK